MEFKPHDYQRRAIDFIKSHKAAALLLGMGMGKTVITLTAVDYLLHDAFAVRRVLVIAPLRVAEDTWSREAGKWDHLQHLRIAKILGDAKKRTAAVEADADVYVVNRENVVWLKEYFDKQKRLWPFDCVVIDELSSFKSNQAERFKALRKVRPFMDRVVGLTGTPAANGLMDLWAQIYLLDQGERLGRTLGSYRGLYFTPGYGNGYVVYKWKAKKGALEAITEKISDIAVSMRAEDYLSLPDRIVSTIAVELGEEALDAYKTMERECLIELSGDEITAMDAAAVMSKLLQIANGFVYDDGHKAHEIHRAKLEALEEIVEAAESPVLVFYGFQADKDLILSKIKGARLLETDKDIRDWNAGKVPVLLAHPASAGYGLNLQDGGHVMAWYGLPWSLEQYQQAVARLQRQGQRYPVMVYHIMAKGTVDEDVAASLARKDMTQGALLNILRDKKKEVMGCIA